MKLATFAATVTALLIALSGNQSVFDLVLFVIAVMGAGFAPLMIVRALNWPLGERLALLMVGGGLTAAVYWRWAGYHKEIFDSLPGMAAALTIYGIGRAFMHFTGKNVTAAGKAC